MQTASLSDKLEGLLEDFNKSPKFGEFFRLMKRKDEDCPEDEDCDEIISPCCSKVVGVVFGSYPLQVKCSECGKLFLLSDLVSNFKRYQRTYDIKVERIEKGVLKC